MAAPCASSTNDGVELAAQELALITLDPEKDWQGMSLIVPLTEVARQQMIPSILGRSMCQWVLELQEGGGPRP